MPLLEGGCAGGGASALLRVPGFLHGLTPPLALALFSAFPCLSQEAFLGGSGVFCFSWHPRGSPWGWNAV